MKTSEMAGPGLNAWIAKALSESPGTAYTSTWPGFDQLLEREAPLRVTVTILESDRDHNNSACNIVEVSL